MTYLLTLTCTVLLLVDFTHSATLSLLTGDVVYLNPSGVKTFNETKKACEDLRGLLPSITPTIWDQLPEFLKANLGTSGNTEVWTNAAKIKGKEGYYWNGNKRRKIDEKVTPVEKSSSCDSDCCNVKWSITRDVLIPVKCNEPETARQLCLVFPMTDVKRSIDNVTYFVSREKSNRIQLSKEVDKLTKSSSSQKTEIDSVSNAKTTLYVLFSLILVAVIALGIFNFVIWKKIN